MLKRLKDESKKDNILENAFPYLAISNLRSYAFWQPAGQMSMLNNNGDVYT